MNALSAAIYGVLSADATLAGMLSTYDGGPAIFSAEPVPFDAVRPFVFWRGALHDAPFGGKVEEITGREVHLDIFVVADASGSSSAIDAIAERVRALLHKVPLAVAGYTNIIARCVMGPLNSPADPRVMARVMTFQWILN